MTETAISRIEKRRDDLAEWLDSEAPHDVEGQAHLDEGSVERTWWHYGYLVAMKDILALLGSEKPRH